MAIELRSCPGCGLEMPLSDLTYDKKFNASPECWSVFEEVLATEFQNAVLFGQVHQLTVDAYAVQHAGGRHPDKSVFVHLVGLYLVMERQVAPTDVPPKFQRLASTMTTWPHFDPPDKRGTLTVYDVALAESAEGHAASVREWASQVWQAWSSCHDRIREYAKHLA